MSNQNQLDKAYRINRMLTIWNTINALSIGLAVMIIIFSLPIMPSGYIYGKTPILQYLTVMNNPIVFILILIALLIIFVLSFFIKRHIKQKYKNILL